MRSSRPLRRPAVPSAALALFGLLAVFAAVPAQGAKISLGEYRQRLVQIRTHLEAGEVAEAKEGARSLLQERVASAAAREDFAPDPSLLGPIARAENLAEARGPGGANLRRLNLLEAELAAAADARASGSIAADRARLERLRVREKLADLPSGGVLPQARAPEGAIDAITDFFAPLQRVLESIGRKILDWLERAFKARKPKADGAVSDLAIAVAVVITLGLAGAAILYVRRRKRTAGAAASPEAAAPPAADDDPLSREVAEWERYARELERAGRLREAVRAWYHAVLVALYRTGFVHYRRGRTNWEYVASLSPSLAVRSGFADLTRRFEREWYGRDESDSEALAAAAEVAGDLLGTVRTLAGSLG